MRKRWAAKQDARKKPTSMKLKVGKASEVVATSTTIVDVAKVSGKTEGSKPRVYTLKSIVYKSKVIGCDLTLQDKVGLLLDQLIALCGSKPEYLRPEDAARYADLMERLKQTTVNWCPPYGEALEGPAANAPISRLWRILEDWILGLCHDSSHLLPHYALDTACFIETMVVGRTFWRPERCLVEPMFGEQIAKIKFLFDRSFKTNFTRLTGGMVRAVVPEGVTVFGWHGSEKTVLAAGDTFVLAINRCHLSESWYENTHLKIKPDPESTGFAFKGYIMVHNEARVYFEVPAYWVTHEIHNFGSRDEKQIAIPERWLNPTFSATR